MKFGVHVVVTLLPRREVQLPAMWHQHPTGWPKLSTPCEDLITGGS